MSRQIPNEEIGPMTRAYPLDLGAAGPCLHSPPGLLWKFPKLYPDHSQKGFGDSGQSPEAAHEVDSQLTWFLATPYLTPSSVSCPSPSHIL